MASKKALAAAAEGATKQNKSKEQTQAVLTAGKKRDKVTFSVRIDEDVLKRWRIYTSLDGYGDKGEMTEKAIVEYMAKHKLAPDKQTKFDTLYGL